jgi:nucleoside-diphosphate-sugar epimerase
MRVLVTGSHGYIGAVMTPMLRAAGHEVVGLDSDLFQGCTFGDPPPVIPVLRMDLRDVRASDLRGFDAVIHLAGLSNDPLGDLDPAFTDEINHAASVRLAALAREAGVQRFLFSSSCSLYGAAGQDLLGEDAPLRPLTPYAVAKVRVEEALARLADERFSPTFLRNATAYGVSPRLRGDLVVNNLVGLAYTSGEVLITSDGTPWRPLVHVEDIGRAFLAALHAPRARVHNEAFNVGRTTENYQIRDLARMVEEVVPGSRVRYATGGGPDPRCYRVDCGKLAATLPEFEPRWTVRHGIEELYAAFRRHRLTREELLGRYVRLAHVRTLLGQGRLDAALRWQVAVARPAPPAAAGPSVGRRDHGR